MFLRGSDSYFCLRRSRSFWFFVCDAVAVLVFWFWFCVLWRHPRFAFVIHALPLCGAALTFFAAAKKVSKESGLTPPARVPTHGPPTSPCFTRQLSGSFSLPALQIRASPASTTPSTAFAIGLRAPICGKRCVGCRAGKRAVLAKKHSVPRRSWCDKLHTVCRNGAVKGLLRLAVLRVYGAGKALTDRAGNQGRAERYRMKDGDVGGPWVGTRAGGVSPLSLLTFFAAAKKVSAAPHRGNTSRPKANRGCHHKTKTKNQNQKTRTATASPPRQTLCSGRSIIADPRGSSPRCFSIQFRRSSRGVTPNRSR